MSAFTDRIRDRLLTLPLNDAKRVVSNILRSSVRRKLFWYAQDNFILDFDDTFLNPQEFRDWRDNLYGNAQAYSTAIQNAVDVAEVVAIWDAATTFIDAAKER